jgi:hypothetical protein
MGGSLNELNRTRARQGPFLMVQAKTLGYQLCPVLGHMSRLSQDLWEQPKAA